MLYADVCVNSPASRRESSFSYAIPPSLDVQIGQAVRVPFGNRLLQGIVVDLPGLPAGTLFQLCRAAVHGCTNRSGGARSFR